MRHRVSLCWGFPLVYVFVATCEPLGDIIAPKIGLPLGISSNAARDGSVGGAATAAVIVRREARVPDSHGRRMPTLLHQGALPVMAVDAVGVSSQLSIAEIASPARSDVDGQGTISTMPAANSSRRKGRTVMLEMLPTGHTLSYQPLSLAFRAKSKARRNQTTRAQGGLAFPSNLPSHNTTSTENILFKHTSGKGVALTGLHEGDEIGTSKGNLSKIMRSSSSSSSSNGGVGPSPHMHFIEDHANTEVLASPGGFPFPSKPLHLVVGRGASNGISSLATDAPSAVTATAAQSLTATVEPTTDANGMSYYSVALFFFTGACTCGSCLGLVWWYVSLRHGGQANNSRRIQRLQTTGPRTAAGSSATHGSPVQTSDGCDHPSMAGKEKDDQHVRISLPPSVSYTQKPTTSEERRRSSTPSCPLPARRSQPRSVLSAPLTPRGRLMSTAGRLVAVTRISKAVSGRPPSPDAGEGRAFVEDTGELAPDEQSY